MTSMAGTAVDAYGALARADGDLARLIEKHGQPDPFTWGVLEHVVGTDAFAELALHIVSQQISTSAAVTIYARIAARAPGGVSAAGIAALSVDDLRAAGVSTAKARALRDLADRVSDGRLSFERLAAGDDSAALAELEAVRGIGPWSATMFLLHHLHRPDVFPAGDVGLQRGAQSDSRWTNDRLPTNWPSGPNAGDRTALTPLPCCGLTRARALSSAMSAANNATGRDPVTHDPATVRIGVLVPLTAPGWVEAGQHSLAGLELGVRDVNDAGGIAGRPLELVVRDSAADPRRAAAAVDELARLGVAALAGEYHSVVARAIAARADALGLPFLCSSAVLDALTEQPTDWVARLAPAQSHGWRIYADFLLRAGHRRIAAAAESSVYWAAGARVLRDHLAPRGGTLIELDTRALASAAVCDELVDTRATALLLLVGHPEPAVSIVKAVRRDQRLAEIMIGAPAGQPEFAEWVALLGDDGAAIPFLRYLPERLSPRGARVERALRERLGQAPSFVAFEGYDTVAVLADVLGSHGSDRARIAESWPGVAVEGTRGQIQFSRTPGVNVWQWAWPPIQVAERDPAEPDRFRVLHAN